MIEFFETIAAILFIIFVIGGLFFVGPPTFYYFKKWDRHWDDRAELDKLQALQPHTDDRVINCPVSAYPNTVDDGPSPREMRRGGYE